MVQNLSGRIFFKEKVEFLKSSIWFQFYASSNKDTFFDLPGTAVQNRKSTGQHHLSSSALLETCSLSSQKECNRTGSGDLYAEIFTRTLNKQI